jgi:hypothetical protein
LEDTTNLESKFGKEMYTTYEKIYREKGIKNDE